MDNQEDIPYFGAPPEDYYAPQRPVQYRAQKIVRPTPPPRKRRSIIRPIIYSVLIMALVFILLSPPVLNMILNNFPGGRSFPETATFTVERRISLSGSADYTLDLPEARDMLPAQKVTATQYDPPPTEVQTKYGGTWNIWRGSLGGFNSHDTITIRMSMETKTMVWKMEESGTVLDIPSNMTNKYTGDEWEVHAEDTPLGTDDRDLDGKTDIMINPSAPEISNLAHQLADDKPDVYSKAKAIYDYMVDNFKYSTSQQMNYVQQEYGGLPKHALATLRDKWGDCDEQSMLYMSFLRALGIPARLELGALYSQKNEWDGHAWALIYIPPSDGSSGNYWYNVDIVNDEFLVRDANRFTTWIDDGDGAHLNDYYHPIEWSGGTLTVSDLDDYVSISYTPSGTVTVKSENSMPGFDFLTVVIAIAVPLIYWRNKRR